MFGLLLVPLMGVVLAAFVKLTGDRDPQNRLLKLMMLGYGLRMFLQLFIRELPLFSHGAGGDYILYEMQASGITRLWQATGVRYITDADFPGLGNTTLPQNLFAFVQFLNGGPTSFGNTAVIAFLASMACLNLYRFAVHVGGDPDISFKMTAVLYFSPAYLFYTCDMFKDGIVVFLIVSALYASFRLAQRFTFAALAVVVFYLIALWSVRFYLVFLAVLPVLIGFVGAGSKSLMRPLLMGLAVLTALLFLLRATSTLDSFVSTADSTYEFATAQNTRDFNALGGSGVSFDDGGNPLGKLYLKVPYTVFSPFPWHLGSMGLQVGKIDATIFGYLIYRAYKAGKDLFRRDRTLLMMFLAFLIPLTIAYAMTMANVGLIVRQRLPIVMITGVLATLSWPRKGGARATFAQAVAQRAPVARRRLVPRPPGLPV